MVSKKVFIYAFLFCLLSACSSEIKQNNENWKTQLEENRAKWLGQHITHYRFSLSLPFSSNNYGRMPMAVEVKDGEVISVIDAHGVIVSPKDDAATASYYPDAFTIAGLFSIADHIFRDNPPSINVSYDSSLGYPVTIWVDPFTEPCCQDYSYEVRDLQVLP